ncbi:MAG: hypothetical protein DRN68_08520 [Thaumarchaeota archaeon]|nr:MAG: hypothetical protein DRN68_08520 [Nitrososphaerota archaeon]
MLDKAVKLYNEGLIHEAIGVCSETPEYCNSYGGLFDCSDIEEKLKQWRRALDELLGKARDFTGRLDRAIRKNDIHGLRRFGYDLSWQ